MLTNARGFDTSKWSRPVEADKAERFLSRHAEFVATHPESKYFPTLVKMLRTALRDGATWSDLESEFNLTEDLAYKALRSGFAMRVV